MEAMAVAIELGNDPNAVDNNGETAMHGHTRTCRARWVSGFAWRRSKFGIGKTATAGLR